MDLSRLSDEDLQALRAGDLSKVSDEGLSRLRGRSIPVDAGAGVMRGVNRVVDTLGSALAKLRPDNESSNALTSRQKSQFDKFNNGLESDSTAFKVGDVGGQVLATLPVGGILGGAAKGLGAGPNLVNALSSSGMTGGNALTRAVGGGITGGVSAGVVNPEQAGTGAMVGAALPGALQLAGKAGSAIGGAVSDYAKKAADKLMQSALKPTTAQLRSGEAKTAVETLLELGISPNNAGVRKLRELIEAKNSEIAGAISSSTASVDKSKVLGTLGDVRSKFGNQVSPTSDLGAIQRVADDFTATTPQMIPVQQAQELKQGTYSALRDKYGQLGSAETEAQKALARGLKEEIATNVPGVGALNAEESRLLKTLGVAERRALMDANKNPMGLAALASNPLSWAAFMADRSATFKALAARMVASAGGGANALQGLAAPQIGYRAAPVLAADQ